MPSTSPISPSTLPSTSPMLSARASEASFIAPKEDKLPHDASVFVGSLPSNIDQGELTRMLILHLSEHTQVKNIKVVRDSKGGVCAFVQCENAVSATALIDTLHSGAPKPFLGRILRYEPARAFRTLLISYRMPTRIIRHGGANNAHLSSHGSEVALELPQAMRVWKHRNSRFHSISYNSDATQAEENRERNGHDPDALDSAIYFNPLDFGKESLHRLVLHFGPLERFSPLQVANVDVDKETNCSDADTNEDTEFSYLSYPAPHNAPRCPSMNTECWEVKWEHRDDCVSALMTLRRVPHLTVTWAHQPASAHQGATSNHHSSPLFSSRVPHPVSLGQNLSPQNGDVGTHSESLMVNTTTIPKTAPAPLLVEKGERKSRYVPTNCQHSWADGGEPSATSGSTEDGPTTGDATDFEQAIEGSVDQSAQVNDDNHGQEIYLPQTPALDKTSITPDTAGSHFPVTPTDYAGYDAEEIRYNEKTAFSKTPRAEREIDPTTLFVGGLEMFGPGAWDEEKVKKFFSRFGGLESVKLVRPLNSCAAFAFVKFNNAEAPARAVLEEHNRVYEGRAMRVQLRDCNPPRNNWKYGRGRGRHQQPQYGAQRRSHYRQPYYDAEDSSKQNFDESGNIPDGQLSTLSSTLSSIKLSPSEENENGPGSAELASISDVSSATRNAAPSEKYLEWYDEAHTDPSLGSTASLGCPTASASTYAYSVPQGQYYAPPPWVQPYLSQATYQVPYYPSYPPVYTPPLPQPSHQVPGMGTGGDANIPAAGWPQMSVFTSYIPYPAAFPRGAGGDVAPVTNQAPLIPTGFIQNEQGTLIPVYQPEALDQYMAGSGGPSPAVTNRHIQGLPQRWQNAPSFPHDINHVHPNGFVPPNQSYTRPKPMVVSQNITPQQFPDVHSFSSAGHAVDGSANLPTPPLYRRPGQRRENTANYYSARYHNHPRSYGGRLGRGHMHNSGQIRTSDHGYPTTGSMANNGWNRWTGVR